MTVQKRTPDTLIVPIVLEKPDKVHKLDWGGKCTCHFPRFLFSSALALCYFLFLIYKSCVSVRKWSKWENNGDSKDPHFVPLVFVFVFNRWGGEERLRLTIFPPQLFFSQPVFSHTFFVSYSINNTFLLQAPHCGFSMSSSTTKVD